MLWFNSKMSSYGTTFGESVIFRIHDLQEIHGCCEIKESLVVVPTTLSCVRNRKKKGKKKVETDKQMFDSF